MPTIKPYKGLSNDRLTDLINSDNGTTLVEGVDFNYGPVTESAGTGGRNTAIELIPTDTTQYTSSVVRYTRLPIHVMGLLPEGEVDSVEISELPFTIHQILPKINEALGLDLTPDEVLNTTHTQRHSVYPLTILPGSLAWLPSTYYFKVELDGVILMENGEPILTQNGLPFELESA